MHIQIITFHLRGISRADYAALCDQLAPTIATMPGLISKTWLVSPETDTVGGVYTWRDRQALDAYLQSDFLSTIMAHPSFADFSSTEFDIMEGPSRLTRGLIAAAV